MKKRLAAVIMALTMILSNVPAQSLFAASSNIEDPAVYHTEKGDYKSGDCILTASKCMIRRALILRGSKAWASVTNSKLRGSATILGYLRNSYTFESDGLAFKVDCGKFSGKDDAARIKEFETLIKLHPEGFVVWGSDASKNGVHGVLVTGVKNGVVYAVDSIHNLGSASKGIQKWSDTSMKAVSKVTKYWYIKETGLAKNAPQPKAGQPIKPLSAGNANYASTLTISDQTVPTALTQGKSFAVRGVISSNYKITKVTVGIYDPSGKAVTSKSVNPGKWSYDLINIDRYIVFGIVPPGRFTYKVSAKDEKKTRVLVQSDFTVKGISKLTVKSYNYPKKIKSGKPFSIRGNVTSNNSLKKVTVKITDGSGAAKITASANPGKKSYSIKSLDNKVRFGKLKRGTYHYIVEATDSVKRKTLVNRKFTVY